MRARITKVYVHVADQVLPAMIVIKNAAPMILIGAAADAAPIVTAASKPNSIVSKPGLNEQH